ncbi:hypothetical protein [Methylobacterium iners]|uniref:hypothetical protein n=1 Tax=Methylobacterium iners TaxID=418707 RepID=UPI001EE17062|nr:hypothetical protein [Methylobacterium iners]
MSDLHEKSMKWVLLPSHLTNEVVKMLWPVNLNYDGCYRDRYHALIEACSAKEDWLKPVRVAESKPAENYISKNWDQGRISIKIQWPDGSETKELVSDRVVNLLRCF